MPALTASRNTALFIISIQPLLTQNFVGGPRDAPKTDVEAWLNAWFVLPYNLRVGTVAEVKGIALTNTFGERFWVEPVREQPEANWERWSLYTPGAAVVENQPRPARLVLLPTVPKMQESASIEEIALTGKTPARPFYLLVST